MERFQLESGLIVFPKYGKEPADQGKHTRRFDC